MVDQIRRTIVEWFFLDRSYDSRFANSVRWFGFAFWIFWLLLVIAGSALSWDPALFLGGAAISLSFAVLWRLIFICGTTS